MSHSSVRLPVAAFRSRLQRLSDELARVRLPPLRESGATEEQLLDAILQFIYEEQRFSSPRFGNSNLPARATVENPGVWEQARFAYLNEVLITREGIPAALAVVLSDVLRRLVATGAIDFVAKVEFKTSLQEAPTAHVAIRGLNNPGSNIDAPSAASAVLNGCTSDALVECLRYLKRAYWPFPWNPMSGGFPGAARAFLEGADSAEAEAIARTARHRLERGIWTSPGGGDLRRAIAAAERLVILRGDAIPEERRDLAVLYCHAGWLREAKAELQASAATRSSTRGDTKRPFIMTLVPSAGVSVAESLEEMVDVVLEDRILALLGPMQLGGGHHQVEALSLEEAMRRVKSGSKGGGRVLPLTW